MLIITVIIINHDSEQFEIIYHLLFLNKLNCKDSCSTFARLSEYNTTTYPTDFVKVENRIVNITVERISIEKNIAHPNYSKLYIHHDIGLSKLSRDPVLGGEYFSLYI